MGFIFLKEITGSNIKKMLLTETEMCSFHESTTVMQKLAKKSGTNNAHFFDRSLSCNLFNLP